MTYKRFATGFANELKLELKQIIDRALFLDNRAAPIRDRLAMTVNNRQLIFEEQKRHSDAISQLMRGQMETAKYMNGFTHQFNALSNREMDTPGALPTPPRSDTLQ